MTIYFCRDLCCVCYYFLAARGRYICFRAELSLIIVKGFVELLIYPRRTKTGELCCWAFLKEPSLSFIHGGGRHKLIHEVVKRREQNMIRMGQLTMLQEGVMMGSKK